jgi:hypothetical protein
MDSAFEHDLRCSCEGMEKQTYLVFPDKCAEIFVLAFIAVF